jgi:3-oxoacyl-[acyl-carrier protein] reductase
VTGTRKSRAIPLGRPGHVDEIASTAVFLASEMASYITGQTIHVDGGTQAAGGWYHTPKRAATSSGPASYFDLKKSGRGGG